jgi:hypothetical protein
MLKMNNSNTEKSDDLRAEVKSLTAEVKAIKTLLEQFKILYELSLNDADKK